MATQWALRAGESLGFKLAAEEEGEWTASADSWNRVVSYVGPLESLVAFTDELKALGPQTIRFRKDGDVVYVSATWPGASQPDGDPEDIGGGAIDPVFTAWTLTGNMQQLPLAQMPSVGGSGRSDGSGIGSALMGQVLAQVRKYKRAADTDDETVPDIDEYAQRITSTDPTRQANARLFFRELVVGNDEWEFVQPVIRKVEIVTAASQVQAGWSNIKRGFTWAQLRAAEPTLDAAVIIGVEALEDLNNQVGFIWQKRAPTLDVQHDGKRQIVTEYWAWEAFSVWRYRPIIGDASSATIAVPGTDGQTLVLS